MLEYIRLGTIPADAHLSVKKMRLSNDPSALGQVGGRPPDNAPSCSQVGSFMVPSEKGIADAYAVEGSCAGAGVSGVPSSSRDHQQKRAGDKDLPAAKLIRLK